MSIGVYCLDEKIASMQPSTDLTRRTLHSKRDKLNDVVPQRWIGRDGPNDMVYSRWSPRSPDLTPCDFFLWWYSM